MGIATLRCEYIWLDGGKTPQLRSKTRVLTVNSEEEDWTLNLKDIPVWSFDGSSTNQAETANSDCVLRPVFACLDSNRASGVLVLCDVLNTDLTPHASNYRAKLISHMTSNYKSEPVIGFEQEYFLFQEDTPLGWTNIQDMTPQGQYYCGVGSENVAGRNVSELHLNSCINSGLSMVGVNAEVALGQWEYQIGGPGVNAVAACDHLWVSRFILSRISEAQGVSINLDPKPVAGDWNGSGLHANFSTKTMRGDNGMDLIIRACEALSEEASIATALDNYGEDLELRLTGEHETCSMHEFRYGVSDRGASVRIPWHVERQGSGYFEDRRPNSNADPYRVAAALISIVCPLDPDVSEAQDTSSSITPGEQG